MSPLLLQFSLCCCLIIPSKHFLQMEWKQRNEIGFLNFSLQIIQLSSNDILCRRSLEFSVHDPLDPLKNKTILQYIFGVSTLLKTKPTFKRTWSQIWTKIMFLILLLTMLQ